MQAEKYRDPSKYPCGIADFSKLRERGCLYVDKTDLIYEMAKTGYVFLSRPRRFGKSLLCSTLRAYFEGRKDLFEGLKIMELEKEWKRYPVFHFSISSLKDKPIDQMARALGQDLTRYEKLYGRNPEEVTPGSRLKGLIQRAHEQTSMQAVVIIDEYDAPLLTHMHDKERMAEVRHILQEFYQTLKECDQDERFVFITGITKFSQMSIFSTINNISNITMSERFATICGITEQELHEHFDIDVEMLSAKYQTTKEGMYAMLKDMYDGYHFTESPVDIYNPFSLLLAFFNCRLDSYWFASGTPTFILNELKKNGADLLKYEGATVMSSEFDQPTENISGPLPLLYQAGYLTVKDYKPFTRSFTLGIPNAEVKAGLMENILPIVSGTKRSDNMNYATYIINHLYEGEYDKAMQTLQSFLSSIPYMQQGKDYLKELATLEAFYQRDLYIFFSGMSANVQCEAMMAEGRTDMVMRIGDKVFVCEFKVSATAQSALDQIDRKKYYEPWRGTDQRRIIKVGAYFDVAERTLKDWKVEEL